MQLVVNHNQSLLDLVIQENGNVATAFELALLNGISLTDPLIPGQELNFVKSILADDEIVSYFKNKKVKIATGFQNNETLLPQLGIGQMAIGSTFIVR
ncbi:hypothetical protein [Flavobacterium soyangense]|uniref:LysM domain-containing protein n=1 Tax=Flavobacterium soyangense TaxID=2023265 RepID=A0A930UBW3_9FLAO|nr:hypothetical protein [Flavobacterium soyangense]MBF2707530.1 hypothetical protein [Flavobacterium soyangense]